jgi:hypothetical protein
MYLSALKLMHICLGVLNLIVKLVVKLSLLFVFSIASQNVIAIDSIQIALLDSYPWSFEDDQGEIKGIYPQLLRQVEKNSKGSLQVQIQLKPLARILHEMKTTNNLDLTIMSFRNEREAVMTPLIRIYRTPFVVLSRAGSPITQLKDLQDKNIAMLWGGSGCPCLDESINYSRTRVSSHQQGIKMVRDERVDGVAGPAIRLFGQSHGLGFSDQLAPPLIYEWRDVWLWSRKNLGRNKQVVEDFKTEFNALLATGVLKDAASEYMSAAQLGFIDD